METKLEDLSGTKAIQRREQIDASKGFIKLSLFFCLENLLWFLNLLAPLMEFRLGLKEETIIAQ